MDKLEPWQLALIGMIIGAALFAAGMLAGSHL